MEEDGLILIGDLLFSSAGMGNKKEFLNGLIQDKK